jgi:prevent-host-death family protein
MLPISWRRSAGTATCSVLLLDPLERASSLLDQLLIAALDPLDEDRCVNDDRAAGLVCSILSMKFRTLSQAKTELGTLIRLAEEGETVVISRHGRPAVRLAVVREEDFSLTTEEIRRLNDRAKSQRDSGRTHEYRAVEELLQKNRPTRMKPTA